MKKIKQKQYSLVQLPNGSIVYITCYSYFYSKKVSTVYIQANLHGSEIIGTSILMKLLILLQKKSLPLNIVVVPQANPLAVMDYNYNGVNGRWDNCLGQNYNRIFSTNIINSVNEEKNRLKEILFSNIVDSNTRLSGWLQYLSFNADYVIDIHATGVSSIPHVFTDVCNPDTFFPLESKVIILWDKKDMYGAFDESHVFKHQKIKKTYACTWEVGAQNYLSDKLSNSLAYNLYQYLNGIGNNVVSKVDDNKKPKFLISKCTHYSSPYAGYISWIKKIGDIIKKNEPYAYIEQPWSGKKIQLKAEYSFMLIGIYGLKVIQSSQKIASIVKID